jgi:hypothetical protein
MSFAFLWWQRQPTRFLPSATPEPASAGTRNLAGSGAVAIDSRASDAAPAAGTPAAAAPLTPTLAKINAEPAASAGSAMPVELHFRHRRDHGDHGDQIEGSILNRSDAEITVELLITSARTHETSPVQLSVPAFGARQFGIADGLDIESGDQLSLNSAPFSPQTAIAR